MATYNIMAKIEKNKTCITVNSSNIALAFSSFTNYINIQHNVDIIRVTAIGGDMFAVGAGNTTVFYVDTPNLISNTHDTILGTFDVVGSNQTKIKEFKTTNKIINGSYTFNIYQLLYPIVPNPYGGNIFIDLEFIEYEK